MATYYIDPDNGVGAGTVDDPSDPYELWSDLPSISAGNSYLQRRGTTTTARISPGNGTAGNPITLGSYFSAVDGSDDDTQPKPILDLLSADNYGILANNKNYIIVENFQVQNAIKTGILFWNNSTNQGTGCIARNCDVYDCGEFGISMAISGTGFSPQPIRTESYIEDCYAENCGSAGMAIVDGQNGCIIRRCTTVGCCTTNNSWGIYMRPRAASQAGTWTQIGATDVWELDLTTGSFADEGVVNVWAAGRRTVGPKMLTPGVYGSVGPNEWATGGTGNNTLQIDIQEDPNDRSTTVLTEQAIDCLIEDCVSTGTLNGVSGEWDGVGIGLDTGCVNGTIRRCQSIDSAGQGIQANIARGTIIHSNKIVNSGASGMGMPTAISIANDNGHGETRLTNRAYNNVVVNSTDAGMWVIRSEQTDIKNNIFTGGTTGVDDDDAGVYPANVYTEDYNCAFGYSGASGLTGGNSIITDPQLNADYTIATASPCKGTGDNGVIPLTDYIDRNFGTLINMGAYSLPALTNSLSATNTGNTAAAENYDGVWTTVDWQTNEDRSIHYPMNEGA